MVGRRVAGLSFTSWVFLPFIAVVLPLYYGLSTRRQNAMLTVASCVFYGAWDWRFLGLLLGSIAVDYRLAHALEASSDPKSRKAILALSCVLNLGLLGFFKYFGFFVEGATRLLATLGAPVAPVHLEIVLPIGISFYTFHSLSYIIDIYRRDRSPVLHFPDYALYVLYFPQLIAGPIARAHDLIPQLERPRPIFYRHAVEGSWLILRGYFKKLVIADNLAPLVDATFNASQPGGLRCLLAVYAFAFQIYGDFSGYTDIARGLGKLMGIDLTLNFNRPYLATDPADFWRRWHISLSTWLRDYLYIPLGGNRLGPGRTYRNLFLTMLLGGLWHGASWHFVAWGAYHGSLLGLHRWFVRDRGRPVAWGWFSKGIAMLAMFHLTCLGWLLFRASNLRQAGRFLGRITSDLSLDADAVAMVAPVLLLPTLLLALEAWLKNADDPRTRPGWNEGLGPLTVACLLIAILTLTPPANRGFLYFQF